MWHQGFSRNFTKLREYAKYAYYIKYAKYLFCMQRKQRQRSTILENIRWTETAYALLCQPHCVDMSSTYIYALILTKTSHPANTEERTQFPSSGYSPKWHYRVTRRRRIWIKSFFWGRFRTKSILVVRKIMAEPLMSHGLFYNISLLRFWTLIV